ncbi:hypothetical protein A7P95_00900 [Eikenella longinqua]|uniref:Uncharacterized protein n=1 Tax=Eikenella longinqua TaxID=1795827 RepID=A0A1A9S0Y2_9NEIS|nr:hypothetical protein A7P95_00900 [Eikenella longinqua]
MAVRKLAAFVFIQLKLRFSGSLGWRCGGMRYKLAAFGIGGMMMDSLATPLGAWEMVWEETAGSVFLIGKFLGMPVAVQLESADIGRMDFDFIRDKVSRFPEIKRRTEAFFGKVLHANHAAFKVGLYHWKGEHNDFGFAISS